ncbi:LacI family DNA-binding transcriptional regulator [Marinicrinis sediminis]|uniref:LacI family DNA-binding transcriptional regulator n=1 Tax=Marinicrinis sediminis TaxID=1652465 RepID=A0ABW5RHL6_9BACL
MNRVSIKDVALQAKVSIATVSNVVNGKGRVSAQTARKVQDVIEQLQYYPSQSARNLKDKQSYMIAVVVPYLKEAKLYDNPFYWKLIVGIEEGAKHKRFQVMLMDVNDDESFAFVQERHLDGMVVVGTFHNEPVLERISAIQKPVVFLDSYLEHPYLHQLLIDDEQGGYLGAKHLIELGHRQIGIMCGLLVNGGVHAARLKGVHTAMKEAGLPLDSLQIFEVHTSAETGRFLAHRINDQFPQLTATFSFSDIGAVGLIRGFHDKKVSVPADMSVIGFDDMHYVEYMNPALTTIRQDVHMKGKLAVEMLMEMIDHPSVEARQIRLPVELITRESAGPCSRA